MKKLGLFFATLTLLAVISACGDPTSGEIVDVALGGEINADGVYTAHDIVYYEAGQPAAYGKGSEQDAHDAEAANAHTVVHITKPGTYRLSGKLERGQIAVDLGENAEDNPNAVVTLILDGADITCEVAPALIFYNVYECGEDDEDRATMDVDTTKAGANIVISDDTVNNISGAYVATILDPDDPEDELHEYDGAVYSRMSMNVSGDGVLNIRGTNEGLCSEMHLTINGGHLEIRSGNDGINTNEDNVSVLTVNDGVVNVTVTGETGEGDGIDSNGWIVVNGGTVIASANALSADAGVDADKGVFVRGGIVLAAGNMFDPLQADGTTYAAFQFAEKQAGGKTLLLKDEQGNTAMEFTPQNAYSVVALASESFTEGRYTLWCDGVQMQGQSGGRMGGPGMMPGGEPPKGEKPFDGKEPPFDGKRPEMPPRGERDPNMGKGDFAPGELTAEFVLKSGANLFTNVIHS